MISVGEAQRQIEQWVNPLAVETVPLAEAHGRVLREAVVAPEDMPPFDRSAMDGYAVREDDATTEFSVIDEIRAGQVIDRDLQPGEAVRIFTGARLPARKLKVIIQEHVEAQGEKIHVVKASAASHVRLKGEDAPAGKTLLEPETPLDAIGVGLLASMGKTSVLVSRRPRILHLTTGDEIVPPHQTPAQGQIRNSNATLIAALSAEAGAGSVTHHHTGDDLPAMIDLLTMAQSQTYDLILISGGSGPGAYDFSAELFRHLRATIHFRAVNVRPGKPLIFGTEGSQVIFGLPGNVLSHFVCFHLFVRRAIDHLLARLPRSTHQAVLGPSMRAGTDRETWWPAQVSLREGRLICRPLPWKSSGDITNLPTAQALIQVPASTPERAPGTMVDLLLLRDFP